MDSKTLRQKYIGFFKAAPRNHAEIPAAPLVLPDDPTTLFTSSGMQPLIPYLKGEKSHPRGVRLANSQPCFRAEDIAEVGDSRHTTFFEMLGNWSLGDYFKIEQISWIWEFFTKELGLSKDKLHVSIFAGGAGVAEDTETHEIWKSIGVSEDHIHFYDVDENWWSRSGPPDKMPTGEIGGPDSEVFYDFSTEHNPTFGDECHPNCQCGRFLEICNCVFIQYKKLEDGSLEELPQKNVDFGGGLERILAAVNNQPDIFQTDLFRTIVDAIVQVIGTSYKEEKAKVQIIADHLKAAVFIIASGVVPSNKLQGYILRRLIRRSAVKLLQVGKGALKELTTISESVFNTYDGAVGINDHLDKVKSVLEEEVKRFGTTLDKGLRMVEKLERVDGKAAFDLYQTYGFPPEITSELLKDRGLEFSQEQFQKEFEKHQLSSRTASAGIFKGGLASTDEQETKYHTATHILHQVLRTVLGDHVIQRGSNITPERLRFDFSHNEKLTDEQIKKAEDLVNQKIQENLPVTFYETTPGEAIEEGAIGAFGERYGERVKVYVIGNHSASSGPPFSREICGGPHVDHTKVLGKFKITKEEAVSSGVRRIYAKLT